MIELYPGDAVMFDGDVIHAGDGWRGKARRTGFSLRRERSIKSTKDPSARGKTAIKSWWFRLEHIFNP